MVRKPPTPQGRSGLLTEDEEARLLDELKPVRRRSPGMVPLVKLALETAMRRAELLALRWENVSMDAQTAYLPMTKNGSARMVPLVPMSTKAVAIIEGLSNNGQGQVLPISYMIMNNCFVAARERACIADLYFHDLRHKARSGLAKELPNVIELSSLIGHQTIQMLKRCYHPSAEALAKKRG